MDKVLALKFTKVIPGHGSVSGREELKAFQAFIVQLGALGKEAVKNKVTKAAFIENAKLTADAGYSEIKMLGVSIGLDREFVLGRSFEEATSSAEK